MTGSGVTLRLQTAPSGAGAAAAGGALAPLLGRAPDAFVSGGDDLLVRFVDSLGGIPLPVRDDLVYETGGVRVVVPSGDPRYDGDAVSDYLRYPWKDRVPPSRAVATGCIRRLGDLATAEVPVAEIWRALAEEWDGDVPPEAVEWAARIPGAEHGAVEVRPVHVDEEAGS
jgi:hypothetical protein